MSLSGAFWRDPFDRLEDLAGDVERVVAGPE
jgi:hypothetical protein